jgi:hypothetical protein
MLATFDPSAWYAWIVYIAAAYLFWTSVFETGHRQVRWIRNKLRPSNDEPSVEERQPDVVLGHPGGGLSTTPLHEIPEGEHGKLVRVEPRYLIENKDPAVGIRDVTTGVRTRDGRVHIFDSFYAGLIGAGASAPVENVGSIPLDLLEGVHESEAYTAFVYWARFTRDKTRWEVRYDPSARKNSYAQIPMPEPALTARVQRRNSNSYSLIITNSGNTRMENVECVLPAETSNWQLLTDVLASHPMRALEEGESQAIPLVVTMGPAVSVELTLRGRADAVPYERTQVVSIIS